MKLIDLLVQELPKRGGWPDGAECAVQDADYQLCFSSHSEVSINNKKTYWLDGQWSGGWSNPHLDDVADDRDSSIVTRDQYESALAVSQKPAWNCEGLPPVGVECEFKCATGEWVAVEITAIARNGVCFVERGKNGENYVSFSSEFRPLRTEAERKRDAAIEAMQREADEGDNWIYSEYEIIYDAIAAGKIPGVKLDD